MKKRIIEELKNKPIEELKRSASESYEKLRKLRFDLSSGKVKNIREIREIRKTIARISTFLGQAKNQK
ncbi:MAG: 50S ribosomal protein L29 [Candidatus Paceibacterota bacterium]|jgi:ribosomal protein L29